MSQHQQQAFNLLLSARARNAFALDQEPLAVRDRYGRDLFGASVLRCYLPYDLPGAVSRFLAHFRPQLGLLLETEIWPNLIHACRSRSIPLFLVNARMSERSAHGYARFAAFTVAAVPNDARTTTIIVRTRSAVSPSGR